VNLIETNNVSFIVSLNTAIVIACPAATDFLCEKDTMQREITIRTLFTKK